MAAKKKSTRTPRTQFGKNAKAMYSTGSSPAQKRKAAFGVAVKTLELGGAKTPGKKARDTVMKEAKRVFRENAPKKKLPQPKKGAKPKKVTTTKKHKLTRTKGKR